MGSTVISWCSKKQDVVALSSTKAEYIAPTMAAQECTWIRRLIGDILEEVDYVIKLKCDNESAIKLASNHVFHARSKHIEMRYHFIREKVVSEEIELANVKTSYIVNIHGPHNDSNKIKLWASLEKFVGDYDAAWILCGDFNEVREESKRFNCEFIERRAEWFNDFINQANLIEVPMGGKIFTQICDNGIKFSKLDRFLVSDKVCNMWNELLVLALERKLSDHCPIILRDRVIDFGPKPTKVFDEWLDMDGSDEAVINAWNKEVQGRRLDCKFRDKLKNVKFALKEWGHNTLVGIDVEIEDLKNKATAWEAMAETRVLTSNERNEWLDCRKKWIDKEKIKASMAKQKSRAKWIVDGDENTKSGCLRLQQSASMPRPVQLSTEQADLLEVKFSEKEVRDAISECGCTKAPGPDGIKFKFFRKHWELIKADLLVALECFWEDGVISKGCNTSFITLVPKVSDPVILSLIGDEQNAFIKGRYVLDGALIANEAIDYLTRCKKKSLVFKVDFEKAFDCLSWEFLLEIMSCMGFGVRWRNWILACLKSTSISILINGSPTSEFNIERGVRQGNPLSPFLFIIAAEGLNLLTKKAINAISSKGSKLVLGLKINFNKSHIFGLGVPSSEIDLMAHRVGCKVGDFPFTYLGLPMGRNMNRVESWKPVTEKFNSRLSNWREKSISFGGRVEPNSLWPSIIKSIHGANGPLLPSDLNRSKGKRGVWLNILRAGLDIERSGIDFGNSFYKVIGDGSNSQFWTDCWLGDSPLKDRLPRLFRLDQDQSALEGNRIRWSDSGWEDVNLDSWAWRLANNGVFTTKILTKLNDEKLLPSNGSRVGTLKNNLVPSKVEIFIWRVLKRRIPVLTEIDKRGIDLGTVRCTLCDDDVETIEHSLILCRHLLDIWDRVYKWWNLGSMSNLSVNEAFHGNCIRSLSFVGSQILQALEWTCDYLIWKNRNRKVYTNSGWNGLGGLLEIQLRSFEWISSRCKYKKIDWLQWISDPLAFCLD
ncbi:uncharacterized protein [Rutidosis leptorrhynchoides]|uniref:uncharacterized protein n=1 Tax=Rutidosis leptorrhynchoides TaxID=125765 RepID=UPI003A9A3B47